MTITLRVESAHSAAVTSLIAAAQDELDRRYGPDTDTTSLRVDQLDDPAGCFVVARVDEHLAGGVGVRTIDPAQRIGEVKRLWVRPDLRGQGVATALMRRIEDESRARGLVTLFLETGHAQPEAHAFYVSTGWERVAAFPPGAHCHPQATKFRKDL